MSNFADGTVRDVRTAVVGVLFARFAVLFTSVWLVAWGLGVLVLRSGLDLSRTDLLWGGLGVPAALGLAVAAALRRTPEPTAVRAWLDRHNDVGGLLMAEDDVELGQWSEKLPTLSPPRLRWRGGRTWVLFTIALGFVVGMFAMPQFATEPITDPPLQISQSVNRLERQIDTLRQEQLVDEEDAKQLEKKLERVKQDASGRDPVKTWEAMDHLEKTVARPAERAAESALRKTESLTRAEALAGAIELAKGVMEPKTLAAAMADLGDLAKQSLKEKLPDDLANQPLDDEALKQLLEQLAKSKLDLREQLRRLQQVRLIDMDALKQCDGLGKVTDKEGLARYLCQIDNKRPGEKVAMWCQGNRPGRGGIARGRGDAPMQFGDESNDQGAKFKLQILPLTTLGDNKLVGTSAGSPDADDKAGPSEAGALSGAKAGGGAAARHSALPRYRGTIDRFFDRSQQ